MRKARYQYFQQILPQIEFLPLKFLLPLTTGTTFKSPRFVGVCEIAENASLDQSTLPRIARRLAKQ